MINEIRLSKAHLLGLLRVKYPQYNMKRLVDVYFMEGLLCVEYEIQQDPVWEDMGGLV